MCGIVGAYGPSASRLGGNLDNALSALAHRGPDAEGRYLSADGKCLLGHRRLSIVDLSESANQPMRRVDQVLAYNGEIYNHRELRPELPAAYLTHSDTE